MIAVPFREAALPQRSGSDAMFFEAPEALPSRGSIPSVHAVDPAIEAARQEMIESQQAPLVKGGPTSSVPPADAVRRPSAAPQACTAVLA